MRRDFSILAGLLAMVVTFTLVMTIQVFNLQSHVRSQVQNTHQLAVAIQLNRVRVTQENCVDQNMRHDKTIAALDAALAEHPAKTPAEQARQRAGRASTITLINALAPHKNCGVQVKRIKTP